MARVTQKDVQELEKNNLILRLDEDNDEVIVKFLLRNQRDMVGYTTHDVFYERKIRRVDCLREGLSSPLSSCPLCACGNKSIIRYYFPVYLIEYNGEFRGEIKFWERGVKAMDKVKRACLDSGSDFSEEIFCITRHGENRSKNTDYSLQNITEDYFNELREQGKTELFNQLKEMVAENTAVPDIFNQDYNLILQRDFDELKFYASNHRFEDDETSAQDESSEERPRGRFSNRDADDDYGSKYGERRTSGYSSRQNVERRTVDRPTGRRRDY